MFKRRTLVTLAAGALLAAAPAFAQFQDRTIKFTNGVNEDHPVGVGVKKMQEVLNAKQYPVTSPSNRIHPPPYTVANLFLGVIAGSRPSRAKCRAPSRDRGIQRQWFKYLTLDQDGTKFIWRIRRSMVSTSSLVI